MSVAFPFNTLTVKIFSGARTWSLFSSCSFSAPGKIQQRPLRLLNHPCALPHSPASLVFRVNAMPTLGAHRLRYIKDEGA